MSIPVVVTYFDGSPGYLKYALKSAARLNSRIAFIGDATNKSVWEDHWDTSNEECTKWHAFMGSYVQMSDYTKSYEIGFWKRLFFLEEWMRRQRVERAFLIESDLVTFADYTRDLYPSFPEQCVAALTIPEYQDNFHWAVSTHVSYWTLQGLSSFTDFCVSAYAPGNRDNPVLKQLQTKYQWHLANKKPGGITEMTLLYLWTKNTRDVFNLLDVVNDQTVDFAITISANLVADEYPMTSGLKKFVFREGRPYSYNKPLKRYVRFLCVHCQAGSKASMKFLAIPRFSRFYWLGQYERKLRRASGWTSYAVRRVFHRVHQAITVLIRGGPPPQARPS